MKRIRRIKKRVSSSTLPRAVGMLAIRLGLRSGIDYGGAVSLFPHGMLA